MALALFLVQKSILLGLVSLHIEEWQPDESMHQVESPSYGAVGNHPVAMPTASIPCQQSLHVQGSPKCYQSFPVSLTPLLQEGRVGRIVRSVWMDAEGKRLLESQMMGELHSLVVVK